MSISNQQKNHFPVLLSFLRYFSKAYYKAAEIKDKINKWKKGRAGKSGGKGKKGRETVIFLHIYVTWGLGKLRSIPENPKTRLMHSFSDLSCANFVFCSAEFQTLNLGTHISIVLNNTVNWNYLINLNLPFEEK